MRVAWATDIHLDFLGDEQVRAFAATLAQERPEAVVLSGDLSHAELLEHHLRLLAGVLTCPIYFVLGNHDYYGSSIVDVRQAVVELCARRSRLRWLPACGVVSLSAETALIGIDGWADARLGDPAHTTVVLNDFFHIAELAATLDPQVRARPGLLRASDREPLHRVLRELGDVEAARCDELLTAALASHPQVLIVTHIPPFAAACWHEGRLSDDNWLPYFSCAALGEVLRAQARAHPQRRLMVLCGHTHGAGEAQIEPNLRVLTGGAVYRRPQLQQVLELA
ncbi:MAG: metallophosphoesterase [Nannocystis sp.]|nr:metallophosphoesterase [Nannocystis sp.]MBA3550581.1 metallophosphoesterase [Nannocystis sp.]